MSHAECFFQPHIKLAELLQCSTESVGELRAGELPPEVGEEERAGEDRSRVSQGTHLFLVAGFSGHSGALKHRDHHENIGYHTWKIRKCVRPERRNKQAPPWPWSCALRKLCPLLGHTLPQGHSPPLQTFLLAHLQPFP